MSLRLDNIIAVGLLLVLCFAALAHGAVETWSLAALEILIGALVLLWIIKAALDRFLNLSLPLASLPLVGLLLLGTGQLLLGLTGRMGSQDIEATRFVLIAFCALLMFFLLHVNVVASRERLKAMAYFLASYGFALALFALLQHLTWNGKFYWIRTPLSDLGMPFGPFANHNHYAGYMEMLVGIPLSLIVMGSVRREKRLFYGFIFAVMGVSIIFSLSRGGIISLLVEGLFIAIVFLWIRSPRQSRKSERQGVGALGVVATGVTGILVAMVVGIWWIGADPVLNRFGENQDTLATSRMWIWRDSLQVFKSYPLLGAGLGSFQTVYPHRSQYDGGQGYVAQSHNDYLQILADGGIIGGLLALWFIGIVWRGVLRGVRAQDPLIAGIALGSGAGIAAILTHSFLDFNLQLPANAMLFLVLCSMVLTCSRIASEQTIGVEMPPSLKQRPPRLAVGVSR